MLGGRYAATARVYWNATTYQARRSVNEGRVGGGFEHLFYPREMPRQPPFHVWVDLTGAWSTSAPGVLLAWRNSDRRGWEAWVMRAESFSTGDGTSVQVVQAWVPAHLLKPASEG